MKRLSAILATLKGTRGLLKAAFLAGLTLWGSRSLGANPASLDVWVQVTAPVTLEADITVSSTTVSVGQAFTAWMTTTNTGSGAGNNLTATVWKASGTAGMAYLAGPNPPILAALNPGVTQIFDWTLAGTSAGTLNLSGSVSTDSGVASNKPSAHVITVQTPASLSASLKAYAASICTGQDFVVTLTVTNTGQATAVGVVPEDPMGYGTGTVAWVEGPFPSGAVTLGLNQSVTFTYTYTGGLAGAVALTATAYGTDANSGLAVGSGPKDSGAVTLTTPGTLVAAVTTPATVSTGQNFEVVLQLTNPAGSTITGVVPSLAQSPPGFATYVSGPTPASAASMPGAGAPKTFTWVFNSPGAGTVTFSLTGTGSVCSGTNNVSDWNFASTNVVTGASLKALAHAFPAKIVEPQPFLVTLSVTNTGGAAALSVTPFLAAEGVPSAVALVAGPYPPAGTVDINPGAWAEFTWTFTGQVKPTTSVVGFNAAGTKAMDGNSGAAVPVQIGAHPSVTVLTHSALTASLTLVPSRTGVGENIVAVFQVNNTGSADANITGMPVGFWDNKGGTVLVQTGVPKPVVPVVIPGNSTQIFTWTYTGAVCGYATVYADANGAEVLTAIALATGQKISNKVNVFGIPDKVIGRVDRTSEKVGGIANVTYRVLDNCAPTPIPVSRIDVSVVVVSGGGSVSIPAGKTDDSGNLTTMLHVGSQPGVNAVRGDAAGTSGATIYVTGTLPSVPEPYLTKNFFNPKKGEKVQLRVNLPSAMKLTVQVFSQAGDLVRKLKEIEAPAGMNVLEWNGRNDSNAYVGNGVYLIQVITGNSVQTKRVIVIKL
jgi:hypothetical protein